MPMTMRPRGFTLVELLVALAIMSLMAILGWRALTGMQLARDVNREHADAVLALDAGLSQWTTDLDALTALPLTRALDWDGRVLRLTRFAEVGKDAGVQVVAWTRAEREGQMQWLRWQSTPVRSREGWEDAWATAAAWAQGAGATAANGLRSREVRIVALEQWQLFFFRGGAWSNALSSAGNSGTGVEPAVQVPEGIRLTLTVAGPHPLAGVLVRDWARTSDGGAP